MERKIPATLVMGILIGYTALGGLLLTKIETWDFFDSFYYSFITMTTVGFGDIVPSKAHTGNIFIILLYIVLGLAITTMCIDLVGVQYIRKIHYFGRKIQDARMALAIVGGKAIYLSEFYANLLQKKYGKDHVTVIQDAFILENLPIAHHLGLLPYIPKDIKRIRYIDEGTESIPSSSASIDHTPCALCHHKSVNLSFANPMLMQQQQF